MAAKELENIGIISTNSKIYPRRFFVPHIGEVKIPEEYDIQDIFELIYYKGHEIGVENGKKIKMSEIQKCLGIVNQ